MIVLYNIPQKKTTKTISFLRLIASAAYKIMSSISIEMQAGIPRQTEAATVYQFIATVMPVSRPRALTANRDAKP